MHRRIVILFWLLIISLLMAGCGQEKRYTLYIDVQGSGSVNPGTGTQFAQGTMVELSPVGESGWVFKEWIGPDCALVASNPWRIVMDEDRHLTAVFEQVSHALIINVTGSGHVDQLLQGENMVLLTAVPDAGWKFVRWEGDASGTETTYEVTLNSDKNVTAVFEQLPFILNVTVSGNGHVDKLFQEDNKVLLTAVPDAGWKFVRWEGDASGTAATYEVTLDSNKNVTAIFEQLSFKVNVTVTGNGHVDKLPKEGNKVLLTAVPDTGWEFVRWEGDAAGTATTYEVTLDSDKNVTAVFAEQSPPAEPRLKRITTYTPVGQVSSTFDYQYDLQGRVSRLDYSDKIYPSSSSYTLFVYETNRVTSTNYSLSGAATMRTVDDLSDGRVATRTMYYPISQIYAKSTYEYNTDGTVRRVTDEYPSYPSSNQYKTYAYSTDRIVITAFSTSGNAVLQTETQDYSGGKLAKTTMAHPNNASSDYYIIYEYLTGLTVKEWRYDASGTLRWYNIVEYENVVSP